jgi:hypothetical protein
MSLTRKLTLTALAALTALAVAAPTASAGWVIKTAAGTAYAGPVTLQNGGNAWLTPGQAGSFESCSASTMTGTAVHPSGPIVISAASWTGCIMNPGAFPIGNWFGDNLPWNATLQNLSPTQAKLVLPSPRLRKTHPGTMTTGYYQAPSLEGTVSSATPAVVSFGSIAGLPKTVTWQPPCCKDPLWSTTYEIGAGYQLRGSGNQALKVVSVP